MKDLQEFLESLFGEGLLQCAEGQAPSQEMAITQLSSLIAERASLAEAKSQLESEVASLKEENNSLKLEAKNNEVLVGIGTSHLKEVREAAVASYTKLMGDKVDETILTLINSEDTNLTTILSLQKSYDTQLEEKYPVRCSKCGSTEVSRASSVTEDPNTEDKSFSDASVSDSILSMANNKLK